MTEIKDKERLKEERLKREKQIKEEKEKTREIIYQRTHCVKCFGEILDPTIICGTCKRPLHRECANGVGEFDDRGYVKGLVYYCSNCIDGAVERKNKEMKKKYEKISKVKHNVKK